MKENEQNGQQKEEQKVQPEGSHEGQPEEQEEVGLYHRLTSRTTELLENGKRSVDEALKKAKEEFSKAGDSSSEKLEKVSTFVKRDIIENTNKAVENTKKSVNPQRAINRTQSFLARILNKSADTLSGLAQKAEKNLEVKTGELSDEGTVACKGCGAEMHFKQSVRIPPCPKCHATVFRKTY